ncbi:general transcription factor 3C polypeptide 1, partial [Sinocyclocheilus anshuiensis]|uniref:general transcription factor 3C polypeptide 1 n=1 Tax=Sinocyclocheilus anshuiensis TaxID=1608454 RepID=UPI0007BAB92B
MESTSNLLSELPDKTGIMMKIREQLRVSERTFKRVYQYMLAAKMVSVVRIPLKELDPGGGPFKTLRGTDVFVRCLKLLKPYGQKEAEEEEDEENNDEDGDACARRSVLGEPRIIERDMLTQAYDIVVSTGTRGISQSALRGRLNLGKLEGRMICRLLERIGMIKGFMEDEGRQRTTKYISKLFVEQSQLNQQFTKERQRSQHLRVTHLSEPEPQSRAEPGPPAGAPEQQVKKAPQKTHVPKQLKQPKLSFSNQATPPKKKSSARVGGAKASQEAEAADSAPSTRASQSQQPEDTQSVIVEVLTEKSKKAEVHETYRLLKRKNMIIEAVRCSKIIEGFYTLQKLLTEEEKKDGISTKVCKKSVVRLIRSLSREGLLKLYRTIVIQDGVQKKVEFVVHPSVTPDDPLLKSAIEQIRLRMSSSASASRAEPQPEKPKPSAPEGKESKASRASQSSGLKKVSEQMGVKALKSFKPVLVPGLGRSMGFLPKMPRLRMVHSFLWYLIHGQPLRRCAPDAPPPEEDPCVTEGQFRVFVKENSWKRYIPPIPLHKDFGFGWALISDVLVSLPLSVFMQVVQVNYQVEGLEQYLKDPVKQHYLIRFLPAEIKRQLLHKRKYIFSFHESLQRLCFMGLLQFGPTEKFMDKDQVFVFLKSKARIVDTTVCDPHYNMAIESLRPFERRHYVFSSAQEVENYWFDLLCVCLNTPLGVIRPRPSGDAAEMEESDVVMATERNSRLLYTLQGSCDVVDDGFTPGDGQGAGGLDSSFFSHLKRNWTWTSHLINPSKQSTETQKTGTHPTVRLRNLLSKLPPPKPATLTAAQSGVKAAPPAVLEEEVRTSSEPSSRNQEVRGGRNLKRKREKKESSKPARKKKRVSGRVSRQSQAQDETDRRALLQMTRQRVTWTHMEDSLLMLCRVASHFLNRKLKRRFVPWTVVRDVLHAEFELSLDKTSLSVGRRARYIMKNPQTCLNYRICLAEMYQDKELMAKFMNWTGDYNDVKVCAAEYKEFVRSLRSKFSTSYGSSDVIIPDTREQLFNKFKVFAIADGSTERTKDIIKRKEDIHVLVLFNLIQSTLVLTNAQMKNYRPFQTFCLYTRYREEVLSQAFQTCRNRALVNRRRPTSIYGLKKCHALPFLPMSYQLSQHYYKFFTWRFPSTIYNEAFDLLTGLCEAGGSDRPNSFSFQKEPETDEDETQGMLQFPMDAPGGASACCLTLMTLGLLSVDISIPQQIVVVDSTLMDSDVVKSLTKALEEEEEEEDDERKRRLEVKPTQASHTNYLLMRGYYTPGVLRSQTHNSNSTDSIMVNTCNVHLQLRQTPTNTLFSSSGQHK